MQRRSPTSPIITLRARQHRSNLTPTEATLWAHLRGHRLGVYFRRQVPLGRFIVDFLAPSAHLIVKSMAATTAPVSPSTSAAICT
jgi:very-short-patch-repair endonuclease